MNISTDYPPKNIYPLCKHSFGEKVLEAVFTYGQTIYNPFHHSIGESIIAHETAHMLQQGDDPETWWVKYLKDPQFRFQQELEAYQVQYQTMKPMISDRNHLARFAMTLAMELSSTLYGKLCTYAEAKRLITGDKSLTDKTS